MAIRIRKVADGLYTAKLILPDMPAVKASWSTPQPMGDDQLIQELVDRGAHQIDILDALDDAERNWPEDRRHWPDEP